MRIVDAKNVVKNGFEKCLNFWKVLIFHFEYIMLLFISMKRINTFNEYFILNFEGKKLKGILHEYMFESTRIIKPKILFYKAISYNF
jgi:hypothetical protein